MAFSDRHSSRVLIRPLGKSLSLTKTLFQCACIGLLVLSINAAAQHPLEPVTAVFTECCDLFEQIE